MQWPKILNIQYPIKSFKGIFCAIHAQTFENYSIIAEFEAAIFSKLLHEKRVVSTAPEHHR